MRYSQEHEEERYDHTGMGKRFSVIMGFGFTAGCVLVMLCGKNLLKDISLLDEDSLYLVRDSLVEGRAYLFYLLPRRVIVPGVLVLLWWYGVGNTGLKLTVFLVGLKAGIWLQACLEQYHLKGILLWIFLYIPYIFPYLAAILCGFALCEISKDRYERKRLLLEKTWLFIVVAVLFGFGLYLESMVHPVWLKSFLKVF
ncbi:MAG: hypothetical protein LUI10_03910 [Lachnospiraceae bacterium]|nr:hypothetical protein [Lachnospiraceae bacterium]